jgi:uncharacterized protein YndB with AHSA1/START domain
MERTAVHHGSFNIERTFRAAPARAFAAWSDPELKARWFAGPAENFTLLERKIDFRVGGRELCHGKFATRSSLFTAHYYAIELNQRIVYAYDMHIDGGHLSTSLATVEFFPTAQGGTRMLFTEQAAFYTDGPEGLRSRDMGTRGLLDRMQQVLEAD